jgi:hypothetical protein
MTGEWASLVAPLVTLVVMVIGFCIVVKGLRGRDRGRARRANMSMRSISGANAALVAATLAGAQALFELRTGAGGLRLSLGLLVVIGLAVVAGLVVAPGLFEALIGFGGVVAGWLLAFLRYGARAALWFLVVSAGMLIVLGLTRSMQAADG